MHLKSRTLWLTTSDLPVIAEYSRQMQTMSLTSTGKSCRVAVADPFVLSLAAQRQLKPMQWHHCGWGATQSWFDNMQHKWVMPLADGLKLFYCCRCTFPVLLCATAWEVFDFANFDQPFCDPSDHLRSIMSACCMSCRRHQIQSALQQTKVEVRDNFKLQ